MMIKTMETICKSSFRAVQIWVNPRLSMNKPSILFFLVFPFIQTSILYMTTHHKTEESQGTSASTAFVAVNVMKLGAQGAGTGGKNMFFEAAYI